MEGKAVGGRRTDSERDADGRRRWRMRATDGRRKTVGGALVSLGSRLSGYDISWEICRRARGLEMCVQGEAKQSKAK